jgi:hypothetical protein
MVAIKLIYEVGVRTVLRAGRSLSASGIQHTDVYRHLLRATDS